MTKPQRIYPESAASAESASQLSLFGPPPLLDGEDSAAYDELLLRLSSGVKPKDILEEIWVNDAAALTWEIIRWRRLRTALFSAAVFNALRERLNRIVRGKLTGSRLAKKWMSQDAEAIKRVNKIMAKANITIDTVMADILVNKLDHIERIDHLVMMAEGRRNAALREIDQHRSALAQALRQKIQEAERAELEVLPKQITAPN